MNRRFSFMFFITTLVVVVSARTSVSAESDRPNIVFILADDLGWSDTTLFGTTEFYQTPNIERLSSRGMTFSHAYAASPLCSPTRASILTGLSPARIGITAPVCHTKELVLDAAVARRGPTQNKSLACRSVSRLKTAYFTLGEALKDAGYATSHFGKWHLGPEPYDPLHHGFDIDIPHWPGPGPAGSFVAPWRFPNFKERTPGEHIEDRMGDEAVAFIEQHKDGPFFLNYWQFSVHAPFDAKAKYVENHRKRVDPNNPQRSPTYAAMVQSLDDNVGKILDTLDRLDIAKRTIVIFFSDNGGNMYDRVDETTPTSNVPLRGGKATMYEGGIRVPCIVVWPGEIEEGSRSKEVIQSVDFYPTILDMLDLKARPAQLFDGINIRPALKGNALHRKAIFTFFPHAPHVPDWLPPAVAVHCGDWKLIRIFHDGDNFEHRYQLYNLKQDIGEQEDLANQYPEMVRTLDALISEFLSDAQAVVPIPNPTYDPEVIRLNELGVTALHDCKLALEKGALRVTSTGQDPYFKLDLPKSQAKGNMTLVLRMKSQGQGVAQLYWHALGVRPIHHRDRSVVFHPTRDTTFHDYRVEFASEQPLVSLRMDPGQSPGEYEFEVIRLLDAKGNVTASWDFKSIARK